MEQLKLFLEKIQNDSALENEMNPLLKEGDSAAIISAGKKHGFSFDESDWAEYVTWLESITDKLGAKRIGEEDLEEVSGGGPYGTPPGGGNSFVADCWFYGPGGSEHRDGMWRKRCRAAACGATRSGAQGYGRYTCKCWGTNRCVNNWHNDAGCNN